MLRQVASFIGALLILFAHAGLQMGGMNPRKPSYNLLNAIGYDPGSHFIPSRLDSLCWRLPGTLISVYARLRLKQN